MYHFYKWWNEYTEELYKEDLNEPDYYDGVVSHQEPDILECEVKRALESITRNKTSGGDGIPVELFQILKDDAVQVFHSIRQQIWKTQQWPEDWKRSVFIPILKKGNAKECLVWLLTKKGVQVECCKLSFIWGKIRTAAQEAASQRALRDCSKAAVGERQYIMFWWRGSSIPRSTHFTKGFLLVIGSDPMSEVTGGSWEEAAERSYPTSEVRGGGQEEQPHIQRAPAAWVQNGQEELFHVQGKEGRHRPR